MKLKAAIRYQAVELVQCAAALCLIIGAVVGAVLLFAVVEGAYFMMPGMGALPYAVMPMLVISTFAGDVRFLMHMGLARRQVLASATASLAAACLFLAAVEAACSALVPFWPHTQSLFLIGYGAENGPLLDFLFLFLGCAATSAVGLAFAALRMRFGSRRAALGLIVLAAAALLALQVDAPAFIGAVSWLFGFGPGASPANPFLLFAAVAALGVAVAWAALRRVEVR